MWVAVRRRTYYCTYCDRRLIKNGCGDLPPKSRGQTRDHVVPASAGGTLTVKACFACNQVKGDMHPSEWRRFMDSNPRWWTLARGCVGG